jgi:membrane-bound ClpP family serine protease
MGQKLNQLLDFLSDFLAHRKGLLLLLGIVFIVCNAILQFFPGEGWLVETNLLLHLGIIVALVGVLLAWAL